jgi:hypothetical protein
MKIARRCGDAGRNDVLLPARRAPDEGNNEQDGIRNRGKLQSQGPFVHAHQTDPDSELMLPCRLIRHVIWDPTGQLRRQPGIFEASSGKEEKLAESYW